MLAFRLSFALLGGRAFLRRSFSALLSLATLHRPFPGYLPLPGNIAPEKGIPGVPAGAGKEAGKPQPFDGGKKGGRVVSNGFQSKPPGAGVGQGNQLEIPFPH